MLFIFTQKNGEMIQFDEHIFRLGWFNHQLVKYVRLYSYTKKHFLLASICIVYVYVFIFATYTYFYVPQKEFLP